MQTLKRVHRLRMYFELCISSYVFVLAVDNSVFKFTPRAWEYRGIIVGSGQLKCDGTRPETRFRLSGKTDESI